MSFREGLTGSIKQTKAHWSIKTPQGKFKWKEGVTIMVRIYFVYQ